MSADSSHSIIRRDATELLASLLEQPDRTGIVCDIDGTLAPIVLDPEQASVPQRTRDLLVNLNRRYRLVACLSGRRAADARRVVGVGALTYIGSHGLERLEPGGARAELLPAAAPYAEAIRSFSLDHYVPAMRRLGIRLEDKAAIWSFHWRGADDERAAEDALEPVAQDARAHGFIPHWGRKVLEIRPPLPVDKGTAIADVVRSAQLEAVLYGGDDTTDLDAFRKLRELRAGGRLSHAVRVGIDSAEAPDELPAEVDLVVDGPDGFSELLALLAT